MIGAFTNAALIAAGSLVGAFLSKRTKIAENKSFLQVMGAFVLLIGIQSALVANTGTKFVVVLVSVVIGGIFGELLKLEDLLSAKAKVSDKSDKFKAFVTTSLLFCTGPMAILGSLNDGLHGDTAILVSKGIIDGTISIALAASLGIGVFYSAVPVIIYEGALTLLAQQMQTLMSNTVVDGVTAVGGMLLMFTGFNLMGLSQIRVANLLPALVLGGVVANLIWR